MNNYLEQEKVINNSWCGVKEVMILLPIKKKPAEKIVHDIVEYMKINKEFYFDTRPKLIPTKKVIDKYNINVDLIRSEASKIRRYEKR